MDVGGVRGGGQAAEVSYSPDQVGTVSAPVYGLGRAGTNFVLTHSGDWSTLAVDFTGNNQEVVQFANDNSSKDGASFDDAYMLQLGTDNGLRKIRISDGALTAINGHGSLDLGVDVFGIGYDAGLDKAGFARFDGTNMSFHAYDFALDAIEDYASFSFDSSTYGTPSGLDFVNTNGDWRMIVATKDAPGEMPWDPNQNYILDIGATDGSVDQFAKFTGSIAKLEDLSYKNGRLATSYLLGSEGSVEVGDYDIITGTVGLSVVYTNGAVVTNGALASAGLGTDFGSNAVGVSVSHAFSITNSGSVALVISSCAITGDAVFAVTGLPSVVDAGAVSNFWLGFEGVTAGVYSAEVVNSNNTTNAVFRFGVSGVAEYPGGVPQWWLEQYGFTNDFVEACNGDQDKDGYVTWQEWICGTVPTNAGSRFEIGVVAGAGDVVLNWDPVASGRVYRVEDTAAILNGFTNVTATCSNGACCWTGTISEGRAFYRVIIEP